MTTIYDLSLHTKVSLRRSKALTDYLVSEIKQQNGLISFSSFMQAALYHSDLGYYHADTFTLGANGDFTTAPLVSPLFAQCFTQQCIQLFSILGSTEILEIGAGTGHFAKDFLLTMEKNGEMPSHYYIYEISPTLRKLQQAYLQSTCPDLFSRITWLNSLPKHFKGIILANEVLDALPVTCFQIQKNQIKERCVGFRADQFTWQLSEPITPGLAEKALQIKALYQLDDNYASEINLSIPRFVQSIADCLSQGFIIFSDYGYGQREYYHPERRLGSLTCFYKHHHHDNPLIYPGLQDITAHVDFTYVAECCLANGCKLLGFTSQAAFLLNLGLIEIARKAQKLGSASEAFKLHQAIKTLTLPMEMGDRIKIMALAKQLPEDISPLLGFKSHDRRREL